MHEHTVGCAGRLSILSRDDLERLDAAALDVLGDVGVAVPSASARRGGGRAGGVGRGRRRAVPAGARAPPRGAGTDAADARRPSGSAAPDRRPLAAHHRRLLRGDLRSGERREARDHGRTTSPPSRVWSTPCPRWISAGRPSAPRTGRPRCGDCTSCTWPSPTPASTCRPSPWWSRTWPRPPSPWRLPSPARPRLCAPLRRSAPCWAPSRPSATTPARWRPAWCSRRRECPSAS